MWVNAIYSLHRHMYYILYADYTKLLFEYTSFVNSGYFYIFISLGACNFHTFIPDSLFSSHIKAE